MESKLVSFILPAYNVAAYLKECVKSIESQNIGAYEIIIVDDGSTDKTLEIATELAKNNRNITVIHQENRGVSSARNNGYKISEGQYVCFVDPDDFYICEFANDFLELANQNELDLIRGQYKNCLDDVIQITGSAEFSMPDTVMSGRAYLKKCLLENTLEVVPFLGFIKREFLKKNNILFPEGIGYEEDQIYMLKCLLIPDCRVMQRNTYFYAYRQRASSVTHNAKPKQVYDIIEIIKQEEETLREYSLDKTEEKIFRKYISASFYQITAIYVNLDKKSRRAVYKKIPKRMIIHSIKYPIRKRFAVKGMVFLVFPELLVKFFGH